MSCRGTVWPSIVLAIFVGGSSSSAQEPRIESARQAVTRGAFDAAFELYEEILGDDGLESGEREAIEIELSRLLRRVGRYEEALDRLESRGQAGSGLQLERARTLTALGRVGPAEETLEEILVSRSSVGLEARYELARLQLRRGEVGEGRSNLYRLIDAYNESAALSSAELLVVGHACRVLGIENPQLFKDALKAYDQAIAADPSSVEARIAVAELFLEKYDSTQAREDLSAALQVDPASPDAHLALARILHFEGSPAAMSEARTALEVNENHVGSRVFLAELLLELEDYDEAEAESLRALDVDPVNLEALSRLAAAHYLRGSHEEFEAVEERVLGINPRFAGFYNLMADACVRNRFYHQAVGFARRALEVEPLSWRGYGLLGLNQLRVGQIEEGRRNLETAFEGDPYNVWIKNTLDLVDTWDDFRSAASERFEFLAHSGEHGLLAPYALALAEEAYEELSLRYEIQPPTPIRLEFYELDADFSVRTIGLAGMGALGVCFGEVVAQDSPRARPRGTFNWGSTLWHEIAHSFTLAASEHRVPRWLTEGLSVLEERRARTGWGDDIGPRFLSAWRDGKLLSMEKLNNGFVRPSFPEQIGLSYLQASYVCELIERDFGFEAILGLLHGYRDGKSTEQAFAEVLDLELTVFDERFEGYLEERFSSSRAALGTKPDEPGEGEEGEESADKVAPPVVVRAGAPSLEALAETAAERPGHFPTQMAYGSALIEAGENESAVPVLEHAKELFPEYADAGSAYHLLAKIHREDQVPLKEARELEAIVAINENDFESRLRLGEVLIAIGDEAAAAAVLDEAIYVFPYDSRLFSLLAEAQSSLNRTAEVVAARQALVALDPVDRAGALFDLSRALHDDERPSAAMDAVLRTLELAPTYEPAQRLLLELHRAGSSAAQPDVAIELRGTAPSANEDGRIDG